MITARTVKPSRGMTVVAMLVCLIVLTLISGAVQGERGPARIGAARSAGFRPSGWPSRGPSEPSRGSLAIMTTLARSGRSTSTTWAKASRARPRWRRAFHARSSRRRDLDRRRALPAAPNRRRVRVRADYPLEASRRSRHTKEFTIDLKSSQKGATS